MAKKTTKAPQPLAAGKQVAELQRLRQQAVAWLAECSDRTVRAGKFIGARNDDGTYDGRRLVRELAGRIERPKLSDDETETVFQIADALCDPGLYAGPGMAAYRAAQRLVAQHGEGALLVLIDRLGWLFQDAARYAGDMEPQPLRPVVCDYCGKVRRGEKWHKAPKPTGCIFGCCDACETSKAPVPDVFASGRRWDEEDA